MHSSLIIICFGVMATLWTQAADAITCYECRSDVASSCKDPFTGTPNTCSGMSCYKAYGKLSGQSATVRGCVSPQSADTCMDYNIGDLKGKACYCTTSLCNSASALSICHLAILLATLLAVFKAIRG